MNSARRHLTPNWSRATWTLAALLACAFPACQPSAGPETAAQPDEAPKPPEAFRFAEATKYNESHDPGEAPPAEGPKPATVKKGGGSAAVVIGAKPELGPGDLVREQPPGSTGYVATSAIRLGPDRRAWVDGDAAFTTYRWAARNELVLLTLPPDGGDRVAQLWLENRAKEPQWTPGPLPENKPWQPVELELHRALQ